MNFDFDAIQYPAFVVVYGRSKHYVTMYNRAEYEEHFACKVCRSSEEAKALLEGYPGHHSDVEVYAVPAPQSAHRIYSEGSSLEYSREWDAEESTNLSPSFPPWIPTAECLPPAGEMVLCSGSYGRTPFCELAKVEGSYWCNENGGALHRIYEERQGPITHWLPLPDHPAHGEKDA